MAQYVPGINLGESLIGVIIKRLGKLYTRLLLMRERIVVRFNSLQSHRFFGI